MASSIPPPGKTAPADQAPGGWIPLGLCALVALFVLWASGLFGVPPWWLGKRPGPEDYARVGWILAFIPGLVAVVNYWVAEAPRAARTGTAVERWLRHLEERHQGDPKAEPALTRITAHLGRAGKDLATSDPPRFAYTLFGALLLTTIFGVVAQFSDGPYGLGVRETSSLGGREAPADQPPASPIASPVAASPQPQGARTAPAGPGTSPPIATPGSPSASPSAAPSMTPSPPAAQSAPTPAPSSPPRDTGRNAATAYSPVPEQKGPVAGETIRGLVFSGLGAYVFALQLMIGRINTGSLTGRFLIRLATQSAIAIVLGVAAAQVGLGFALGTERQSLFLYFALGLFPGLVRQMLSRRGRALFASDEPVSESLPLSLIDGIDEDTVDRLAEMGISDAQHLATVDPIEFMLKAGYPPMRALDWIDQAMFVTYARRRILAARAYGIRGAIDFAVLYLDYLAHLPEPPPGDTAAVRAREVLAALAIRMEMTEEVLLQIGRALWEDENLRFVWLLWMNRIFWDDRGDRHREDRSGAGAPSGSGGGTGTSKPVVGLNLTQKPDPGTETK